MVGFKGTLCIGFEGWGNLIGCCESGDTRQSRQAVFFGCLYQTPPVFLLAPRFDIMLNGNALLAKPILCLLSFLRILLRQNIEHAWVDEAAFIIIEVSLRIVLNSLGVSNKLNSTNQWA